MPHRDFDSTGRRIWRAGALIVFAAAGCGGLSDLSLPGIPSEADLKARFETEQEYRRRYQVDSDPEAIRWLKANRIASGMTVGEVGEVLGEEGRLVIADRKFKTGNLYRRGDKVYEWGPDSDGASHYLVFREGRLVNFDPEEYRVE